MNLDDLIPPEIKMLEILAGKRELEFWGAWVTVTCEVLKSRGYAAGTYHITEKGKNFLVQMECNHE